MSVNWSKFKLSDLGFVGRGKSKHRPRNDPILYGGNYPFFQTGDVKNANLYLKDCSQTYNEKGLAQSKLWKPGTLCITIAANIAETAILSIEGCFPDSIIGFIPDKNKADVRFIKYYIDLIKLSMQSISQGTTQDNLSLEKLASFDFLVPPLPIQRKISDILSAYDDLIENNNRRIKILEEMAQRIYREWFVHFRYPNYKNDKLVESELGMILKGWKIGTINDVVTIKSGFAFKSKTFVEDGSYRLVTIKNVQEGQFITICQSRLKTIPDKMPDYCYLSTGDILLSLTGNIGRVCLVYDENYLLNQRVAKLIPNSGSNRAFSYFTFRNKDLQKRLEIISTGVAQQNLSPVLMGELEFVIPPESILEKYSIICEPVVDEILLLNRQNQNLRQTRNFLLPKLISDKIDVSELDIDIGEMDESL